ncbi:hypothetical protein, partial [Escherichia coli]|uniref:hypothetical protein n=1 Tax=Escherichia coli TaxID=562 RepID=UPI0013FB792A
MTSMHPTITPSELVDDYTPAPVVRSDVVYEGWVWDVVQEEADLGDAGRVTRDSSAIRAPSPSSRCAANPAPRRCSSFASTGTPSVRR